MTVVYISIGSNVDPEPSIRRALLILKGRMRLMALSTLYRTHPVGCADDASPFVNAVLQVETEIAPRDLKFGILRPVEDAVGRQRTSDKYAPRTIDLDIIVYGDAVISGPDITIPDPEIFERAFIAAPLAELDPDLILPGGKRIADVAECLRNQPMIPLHDLTAALRTEVLDEPG